MEEDSHIVQRENINNWLELSEFAIHNLSGVFAQWIENTVPSNTYKINTDVDVPLEGEPCITYTLIYNKEHTLFNRNYSPAAINVIIKRTIKEDSKKINAVFSQFLQKEFKIDNSGLQASCQYTPRKLRLTIVAILTCDERLQELFLNPFNKLSGLGLQMNSGFRKKTQDILEHILSNDAWLQKGIVFWQLITQAIIYHCAQRQEISDFPTLHVCAHRTEIAIPQKEQTTFGMTERMFAYFQTLENLKDSNDPTDKSTCHQIKNILESWFSGDLKNSYTYSEFKEIMPLVKYFWKKYSAKPDASIRFLSNMDGTPEPKEYTTQQLPPTPMCTIV